MSYAWQTDVSVALSQSQLEGLLDAANLLADVAADAIRPHFRVSVDVDNKRDESTQADPADCAEIDPVTQADRAAEQAIRDKLSEIRPDDSVFGEEFGFRAGSSGLCWIIDPIDGTRGFVCGLPTWGTLVGLHDGVSAIAGVMNQPVLGERFIGSSLGAYLLTNNATTTLSVSGKTTLADAYLCTTSPDLFVDDKADAFQRLKQQVSISRYGTDCYGYSMLAAGQVDVVVETGLQPYDIQALIPIVEAAGGVITDWSGNRISGGGDVVAAASVQLHETILEILAAD